MLTIRRRLVWIIPLVLAVLVMAPAPIAERYTSPTQDGQFLLHPIKSYRFLVSLVFAEEHSKLTTPGDALTHSKVVFADSGYRPVRVALLYLGGRESHLHVTRSGMILEIDDPPSLVWEIWGVHVDPSSTMTRAREVIGFLDYETGLRLGTAPRPLSSP